MHTKIPIGILTDHLQYEIVTRTVDWISSLLEVMKELRHVGRLDGPEVDGVLRLGLATGGGRAEVPEPREGRHEPGITGLGRLLEI